MKDNFDAAMELVFKHEGGYVDHPRDPGGATNLGITFVILKRWRKKPVTKQDVKDLTKKEAKEIYKTWYWDKVNGDDLPAGLDYAMFDFGVNSGPDRAIRFLQKVVGTTQDGKFGPKTLAAVEAADTKATIEKLCASRLTWLHSLPTWGVFGKGWRNRVNDLSKDAVSMVQSKPPSKGKGKK